MSVPNTSYFSKLIQQKVAYMDYSTLGAKQHQIAAITQNKYKCLMCKYFCIIFLSYKV